jgi:catechol 2,3-dioxygenase-like lactoylglutathione lyase family enzyme
VLGESVRIGHVTLLVKDYDEAIEFYVGKLGFEKRQDAVFWENNRWVTVSPKDQPDFELTFVLADTETKQKALGKQAGDHVFMTLQTDDCKRDYQALKSKGVKFFDEPTEQAWGIEVVFEDLYGNLFDLVERFPQ